PVAVEVVAVVAGQVHARLIAQPRFDFRFEVELFAFAQRRLFQFFGDEFADVADPEDGLRDFVQRFAGLRFRRQVDFEVDRRFLRRQAGRFAPAAAGAAAIATSRDFGAFIYSTVTVFARFRGWSTLSPRARAMS